MPIALSEEWKERLFYERLIKRQICRQLDLHHGIKCRLEYRIPRLVRDAEKNKVLQDADVFMLPSY